MGTNKRYAHRLDDRADARALWHPRTNAFPTRWVCRNGRWGSIYGVIEAEDVHRDGAWVTVFHAFADGRGTREPLGEFHTGDAAAEALWARFRVTFSPASKNGH